MISKKFPVEEQLFFDGSSYFQALLDDLAQAESTVNFESYIFAFDELGARLCDAFMAAAERGVKVRLLVDGAGTPGWGGELVRQMEDAGIETRVYHPFPWRVWQWSRAKVRVPLILKALYLLLKINTRNHRKVCLIDNDIAYIGSFNVTTCHLNREQQGGGWRDAGVRLKNSPTKTLSEAFEAAWEHRPVPERIKELFRKIKLNPALRLNNTRHLRRTLYKNLLLRIGRSKEHIWIANAYFIPDNFLLKRLKRAAQRGVDVKLLLPGKSDVALISLASNIFYATLLSAGVKLFEYLPSMLHAKILIIDNWVTLGSSNLNQRSLLHDLEVDVNLRYAASKQQVREQFLDDLHEAKEITLAECTRRPWYKRIAGRILLYIRYWI